ncbi:rust resistance kinase Lr10-like [Salvia hispanica]|uniref:rust resistance kinase Lr10-like n=1 Tax=Salvia hispanica TaxID=49212 RepID=UPI00200985F7|nr:rust resistance kinase Lr10-like [Salvia hispanica]
MSNGSLNRYISEGEKAVSLDWGMKSKLIVGVARSIEYLHGGCDMKILHFDIKPHNILVNENFVPKISDFGLAKLYPTDKESVTLTTARSTIGFVAPEIIDTSIGRVSHKADVYSFGILLMEIAGGIANFKAGINNVDDENEIGKIQEKMAIVGLWCTRTNPDEHPTMSKVLEM